MIQRINYSWGQEESDLLRLLEAFAHFMKDDEMEGFWRMIRKSNALGKMDLKKVVSHLDGTLGSLGTLKVVVECFQEKVEDTLLGRSPEEEVSHGLE